MALFEDKRGGGGGGGGKGRPTIRRASRDVGEAKKGRRGERRGGKGRERGKGGKGRGGGAGGKRGGKRGEEEEEGRREGKKEGGGGGERGGGRGVGGVDLLLRRRSDGAGRYFGLPSVRAAFLTNPNEPARQAHGRGPTLRPTAQRTQTVTITATDPDDNVATTTFLLDRSTKAPPTASLDGPAVGVLYQPLTFTSEPPTPFRRTRPATSPTS